jgi:hypothetical protein
VRSRHARLGLIAGIIVIGVAAVLVAARWQRDRVPGHAYAIPSGDHRIVVEVLNGTRRDGLARTATRLLRQKGLDVVFFGSADSAGEVDSTKVLVRRGEAGAGATVAKALGTGRAVVAIDSLRRVDVSVILGKDFVPGAEVHP